MKRFFATVLAGVCALSMVGCSSETTDATTETPTTTVQATTDPVTIPTETATIPMKEYTQEPMVSVSLPVEYEIYGTDEVTYFTHSCQYMTLIQQDPAVAEKIVVDFQTRQADFHDDVQTYAQQAEANYNGNPDTWTTYLYNVLYSPTRIDHSVLSLYGTSVHWAGAVHPEHHCISANYNMITGDVLTLGSILAHADQIQTLGDLLIEGINEIKDEKAIMSGFEDSIRNRLETNVSYDEKWYFSGEGLCFYFSPYEIAPYASGTIVITIPYEKLVGVLDDAFFPTEREYVIGEVTASRYEETDHESLTQITEVVLDREGEMIFLYTDGKVYDVAIELGQWNKDGTIFTPTCTVFATQTLTPGDAVMLQTAMADTMSTLRLTYTSKGTPISRYITQSGEDGSILLVEQ